MLDAELSRRAFLKAAGAAAAIAAADPAKLVDRALDAYGGLSGIVRPGDTVIIKANFSWAYPPEQGGCNNPGVLARIMQRCAEAGAGSVTAVDYTIEYAPECLRASGIKQAVEDAGFHVQAFEYGDFEDRTVDGVYLKVAQVPKLLRDADVLIDVPAVKSHGNTLLTAGMKNLMGLVLRRNELHYDNLDQNIADIAALFRPDLTIADAYLVVKNNGPRGSTDPADLAHPHQVVVGDDIVAVDAYCASYLDLKPEDVAHIKLAAQGGLGQMDLGKMSIVNV